MISKNGNAIRFDLNSIDLPPASEDSAGSSGWVQSHVKLRSGLAIGTNITNTAHIYFDYNAPIATNITLTTIANTTTGLANITGDNEVSIYPDPAHDWVYIKTDQELTNGHLDIYDVTGRKCKTLPISDQSSAIEVRDLVSGVYIVNITLQTGKSISRKLIIE